MRRMFASATLKLTAWYLIILVTICVIFSFIIFELSTSEISNRLERLQIRAEGSSRTLTLPGPVTLNEIRMDQTAEARTSIFIGLVYMNVGVLAIGGAGSYLLARRTLRPIEEAHEAQSRFTSDASHELRTPLAIMKSEIQVAMRDPATTKAEYRELLDSTLEEVDKLTDLSHSLLQLSRLDYVNIQREDRITIVDALQQAAVSLKLPLKRFIVESPGQPAIVTGNETMLNDLFRILLDNAMKYSPKGTNISAHVSTNGRTCKLIITNEGKGISPDDIEKIFDRFYRSEKSRSSSVDVPHGYGLGLSLAKKIVTLHEGTISVESQPDVTTAFIVTLPQFSKNR